MSPLRRAATASLVLGTLVVVASPARAGLIVPPMGVTVDNVQTTPIGDPTFILAFTLTLQPGWALVTRDNANFFDPANDGIDIDIDYLGASHSQPLGFAGLASGTTLRYFFYGQPIYGSIIAPIGGPPVDLAVEIAGLTGLAASALPGGHAVDGPGRADQLQLPLAGHPAEGRRHARRRPGSGRQHLRGAGAGLAGDARRRGRGRRHRRLPSPPGGLRPNRRAPGSPSSGPPRPGARQRRERTKTRLQNGVPSSAVA